MKSKRNLVTTKLVLIAILGTLSIASLKAQVKVVDDGRVGIGTTTPHPAAKLEIYSENNNQGFLMPRVTLAQRNVMPTTEGLQVYVLDDDGDVRGPYYWDNVLQLWIKMDAKQISWTDIDNIPNSIDDQILSTNNDPGNISISEGNEITINVGDASNTNELQTLQLNGDNLSISGGNTVDLSTIQAEDPNAWKLSGNNSDANDFLGTTGNAPLRIGTGGDEAVRISENGNVGIGLINPSADLHVRGHIIQEYPNSLRNVVIGHAAGNANMAAAGNNIASHNVFMGERSGSTATSADFNNFLGYHSGRYVTTARGNNFLGREAGKETTTGSLNNFFGWIAGRANTTGTGNNFIGGSTGLSNIDGSYNNFMGSSSGASNISGSNNTFIGLDAGRENKTGGNNNFIGRSAGRNSVVTSNNNFIGLEAGLNHTIGHNNNYIGNGAGKNSVGTSNNFIGLQAGLNNAGSFNIAVGIQAGANATGIHNIALGTWALQAYSESTDNTTEGNGFNIAIGGSALQFGTDQGKNIGIGWKSLMNNNGKQNVSIGHFAGESATGDYNVALGSEAGMQSAGGGVFVGFRAGALETTANKLYIDNSNTSTPLIYGDFDDDRLRVNGTLEVSDRTGVATVGAAFDANDQLVETPLITNNNQLINGQGYITSADVPAAVTWSTLAGKPADFADDQDAGTGVSLLSYTNNGDEIYSFVDNNTPNNVMATFKEGPGVNLESDFPFLKISSVEVDGDVTNELQDLYLNGTTLGINNGNTVNLDFLQNDPLAWKTIGNNVGSNPKLGTLSSDDLPIITSGLERLVVEADGRLVTKFGFSQQENIVIGSGAGNANMTAANNILLGERSGQDMTTGHNNIFLGKDSGKETEGGYRNTMIGFSAGKNNVDGDYNLYLGDYSGYNVDSGHRNVFLGEKAGYGNTNVSESFQFYAFKSYNNYIGFETGFNAVEGRHNNYIGVQAGAGSSSVQNTGHNNNFIGYRAGRLNTTGDNNNFIGNEAGYNNEDGAYNIFIGDFSGKNAIGSSNNVFLGGFSGYLFNPGQKNTLLGYKAEISTDGLNHATAIGAEAVVNESNKIYLHTGSATGLITGDVDYTDPSDSRFKSYVNENVPGLDMVLGLRPVNYKFDYKTYIQHLTQLMPGAEQQERIIGLEDANENSRDRVGFIAQEVDALTNSLGYEFGGLHKPDPKNPTSHYTISYSKFVVPLVKAVQEQQVIIDAQEARIADLENRVGKKQSPVLADILAELEELKAKVKTLENK